MFGAPMPPMGGFPPPAPPQVGMPTLGYNWWDYAQEKAVDTKATKIGYNLASVLARDRLKEQVTMVPEVKIKLFDYGTDNELFLMLDSLGFKIERIKTPEVPQHVIHNKLDPLQIIVISNLINPQPREVFKGFEKYVEEGGRILFYHCAPQWINVLFPGKVTAKDHSTCVGSKIKITGDKELFTGFAFNEDLELEHNRWPLDALDLKNVKVLCKIYSNIVEPLLVKWTHSGASSTVSGGGIVYVIVSQLLCKSRDAADYSNYLKNKDVNSRETLEAWNCAFSVGYKDAIVLAMKLFPSMELVAKIIMREWAIILPLLNQRILEENERRQKEEMQRLEDEKNAHENNFEQEQTMTNNDFDNSDATMQDST